MRSSLVAAVAFALLAPACGHGLAQTAKTQPPGSTRMTVGGVVVTNENDAARRGVGLRNVGPELAVRVGTSDHTDVGVSTWFGSGLRTDVKWNLASPDAAWALAPRFGFGGARDFASDVTVLMAMAGVIGSYEITSGFTPYLAATFMNHWIWAKAPTDTTLAAGESYAARAGYGDGLVQLVLGLQLRLSGTVALVAEAQRWIPGQNDPGDFYKFVPNNVFLLGTSLCFNASCDWGK